MVELSEHEQTHLRQAFMRGHYQRSVGSFTGPIPGLTGIPLFEHFLQHGFERNISPSLFFDSAFYQSQLPTPIDIPFILHFMREGAAAGLKPHRLIDPEYVAKQEGHSDLPTVLSWLNTDDGRDARTHPLFWGDYYLESNPDIELPDINALAHYLTHPFQTKQSSPREPNPFFTSRWYAEKSAWEEGEAMSPLEHFVAKGMLDDLSPSPLFDKAHYRDESGIGRGPDSPVSSYMHFMTVGLWDDISPHSMIDPSFIRSRYPDTVPSSQPAALFYLRSEHEQRLQPSSRFHSRGVHGFKVGESRQSPWRGHVLERYLMGDARGTRLEAPILVDDDIRDELLAVGEISADYAVSFLNEAAEGLQRQNFNVFLDPRTRLLDLLDAEVSDGTKAVIAIPAFRHGGAELIAANIAQVFSDRGIPTVILVTELAVTADLGWFPADQPIVDLASMRKQLSMNPEDVVRVLGEFLLGVEPAIVVNVNSSILWKTYDTYGLTLSQVMSLWTNLFCFDYDTNGFPVGYANRLVETIDYLDTILVDNQTFADLLCDRFGFGEVDGAKFTVSRTPMLAELEAKSSFDLVAKARPQALWTGRFAPQKRPDFCYEVAALVPEVDFVMFGTGDERPPETLPNAIDGGIYDSFASIAPWDYDLFFHTAAWEGLPVSLVEAAGAGLPVVAPLVGGIGEILDASTGYPLQPDATPEEYAVAVRACIADRAEAKKRADALRTRVGQMHSWNNFEQAVTTRVEESQTPKPGPFKRFKL